jgi:hypothetical protein
MVTRYIENELIYDNLARSSFCHARYRSHAFVLVNRIYYKSDIRRIKSQNKTMRSDDEISDRGSSVKRVMDPD